MRGLGALGGPSSDAIWINNRGQILGDAETSHTLRTAGESLRVSHSILWTGGKQTEIEKLIPLGSGWSAPDPRRLSPCLRRCGREAVMPLGLNDRGQIVGWGWFHGKTHPFLMSPHS